MPPFSLAFFSTFHLIIKGVDSHSPKGTKEHAMKFSLVDDLKEVLSYPTEDYPEKAGELILPFFKDVNDFFDLVKEQKHEEVLPIDSPFNTLQIIVISAIFIDGDIDQAEYDVYSRFCRACHYNALDPKDVARVMDNILKDKLEVLKRCAIFVGAIREAEKNKEPYHDFLKAMWCLLCANEDIAEGEFAFMTTLYDSDIDDVPSSFSACKKALAED